MTKVSVWTGVETRALRSALRMSTRAFADHLGVATRTVSYWESAGATGQPRPDMQELLDTALRRAPDYAKGLFDEFCAEHSPVGIDERLRAGSELGAVSLDLVSQQVALPAPRQPVDPSFATHWTQMLAALAAGGNAVGGHGLLEIISTEVTVIGRLRENATGTTTAEFTRAQARWQEFGSWIADNQGDHARATAWLKQAGELAVGAGDDALAAYVLMRRAQRAFEHGDPRLALDLTALVSVRGLPPRIRALLATRTAQAHAALGDGVQVRRHLKVALSDVGQGTGSELIDLELAPHCTVAYVQAHEGSCLLALQEPNGAVRALESVLQVWPATQRLDEGLFRAQLAAAHAMTGALDEAAEQARAALTLGVETGSRRILDVVGQVIDQHLVRAGEFPELAEQWKRFTVQRGS